MGQYYEAYKAHQITRAQIQSLRNQYPQFAAKADAATKAQLEPVVEQYRAKIEADEAKIEEAKKFRPSYAPKGQLTKTEETAMYALESDCKVYLLFSATKNLKK